MVEAAGAPCGSSLLGRYAAQCLYAFLVLRMLLLGFVRLMWKAAAGLRRSRRALSPRGRLAEWCPWARPACQAYCVLAVCPRLPEADEEVLRAARATQQPHSQRPLCLHPPIYRFHLPCLPLSLAQRDRGARARPSSAGAEHAQLVHHRRSTQRPDHALRMRRPPGRSSSLAQLACVVVVAAAAGRAAAEECVVIVACAVAAAALAARASRHQRTAHALRRVTRVD